MPAPDPSSTLTLYVSPAIPVVVLCLAAVWTVPLVDAALAANATLAWEEVKGAALLQDGGVPHLRLVTTGDPAEVPAWTLRARTRTGRSSPPPTRCRGRGCQWDQAADPHPRWWHVDSRRPAVLNPTGRPLPAAVGTRASTFDQMRS